MKTLRTLYQFSILALTIIFSTNSALAKACPIPVAECGYTSTNDVNQQMAMLSDSSLASSFAITRQPDGTYYVEFIVYGRTQKAGFCEGLYLAMPDAVPCGDTLPSSHSSSGLTFESAPSLTADGFQQIRVTKPLRTE